jgi:hypothetical protein
MRTSCPIASHRHETLDGRLYYLTLIVALILLAYIVPHRDGRASLPVKRQVVHLVVSTKILPATWYLT